MHLLVGMRTDVVTETCTCMVVMRTDVVTETCTCWRACALMCVCPSPYGGTDPLGMFPLFIQRTADVMATLLSVVFLRLVRLGSFPACWRQANITSIPKGPPLSSVANYRQISITSVLSKVFERLVSVRFGRFMERSGVLPTTQFAYRKGLGTCDALLCVSHTLQSALESGQKARIVQTDFSAAFDRVNHLRILYKLCSVGIGSCPIYIDTVSIKLITASCGGWLSK